jgi:hypothetical protein
MTGAFVLLSAQQASREEIQQRVAAFKDSMAQNQRALAEYTWKQQTQMLIDGDVKNTSVEQVRIGPDGKMEKTPLSDPNQQQQKKPRGLKGKIAAKKMGEMKAYIERLMSLCGRYMKPLPDRLQQAVKEGRAEIVQGVGSPVIQLKFKDYYKAGDLLAISVDREAMSMHAMEASTYLDGEDDPVSLSMQFDALQDGTSYMKLLDIGAPAQKLALKVSSFEHEKVVQ